jgi:hypothetical protein
MRKKVAARFGVKATFLGFLGTSAVITVYAMK